MIFSVFPTGEKEWDGGDRRVNTIDCSNHFNYNIHVVSSYIPYVNMCICHITWWFRSKEFTCKWRRCRFHPWVGKIPRRRKWQPTPEFLPGKSHRQEFGGLQSKGSQRVGYNLVTTRQHIYTHMYIQTNIFFCQEKRKKTQTSKPNGFLIIKW